MAQLPVANALTLELEPVVADNLARFLDTADSWYAHDYVPFDEGRDFAFLGGEAKRLRPRAVNARCTHTQCSGSDQPGTSISACNNPRLSNRCDDTS